MSRPPEAAPELVAAAFLLPAALRRARAAHARLSFVQRLLGDARAHAAAPGREPPDRAAEREAVGLDDGTLDEVAALAAPAEGGVRLPQAARLHRLLVEGLDDLVAPLVIAGARGGGAAFHDRLHALLLSLPATEGDLAPDRYLGLTLDAVEGGLTRLMADLQDALDALEETLVHEEVAGAHAYGLSPDDRAGVAAFMSGLNRTSPLAFGAPGLDTTAIRAGAALRLHVELVPEEPHLLTLDLGEGGLELSYADPHLQRVRFFQGLLAPHGVAWSEARAKESRGPDGRETVYQAAGRLAQPDRAALAATLEAIGSRLVFLLDWNRARKRLRGLVDGPASQELLRWAADREVGHRAFLELGGERLVYEAVEGASPTPVRYGQRLDELLGREAAIDFLRSVFRAASDGLRRGRSERFIRDEIRADLLGRFETLEHGVLALAGEHAVLIGTLAAGVRDAVAGPGSDDALAQRAAAAEQRADGLVERVRTLARRSPRAKLYARLLGEADDVADDLEDAVFLLTLPAARGGVAREALGPLAGLLVEGAEAWRDCLAASAHVTRGGAREDLQTFLEAVDRLVTLEHQTDAAERRATAVLLGDGVDPRQLVIFLRVGQALEQASDALKRGALLLRDHFMTEVMPG